MSLLKVESLSHSFIDKVLYENASLICIKASIWELLDRMVQGKAH